MTTVAFSRCADLEAPAGTSPAATTPALVEHRDAELLAEHLELLDGGGAVDVGGDEERLLALP